MSRRSVRGHGHARNGAAPANWVDAGCGCDKRLYVTKKAGKAAARQTPGGGLHVYPCPSRPGFHIGHLPREVIAGVVSREEYYERPFHLARRGGSDGT